MSNDNLIGFPPPAEKVTLDSLTELLREGARELIANAVQAELQVLLQENKSLTVEGEQAVLRNGYLPERTVQTGVGETAEKVPKVRDRSGHGIKLNSQVNCCHPACAKEAVVTQRVQRLQRGDFCRSRFSDESARTSLPNPPPDT